MTQGRRPRSDEELILELLYRIIERLTRMEGRIMATQADVDALATELDTVATDLTTEIQSIKDANPSIDLSGLSAVADRLKALDVSNAVPVTPVDPTA